jgi:hypothetical protein
MTVLILILPVYMVATLYNTWGINTVTKQLYMWLLFGLYIIELLLVCKSMNLVNVGQRFEKDILESSVAFFTFSFHNFPFENISVHNEKELELQNIHNDELYMLNIKHHQFIQCPSLPLFDNVCSYNL